MPANDKQKEYLSVLLAEYATMRSQLVARGSSIVQIASIAVASLALAATSLSWVIIQSEKDTEGITAYLFTFLFVFLLALTLVMIRLNHRDVTREAAHVRHLERVINQRVGAQLLGWESNLGGAKVGYWIDFWPNFRMILLLMWPLVAGAGLALLTWIIQLLGWLRLGWSGHMSAKTELPSIFNQLYSNNWIGWNRAVDWLADRNLGWQLIACGAFAAASLAILRAFRVSKRHTSRRDSPPN